MLAAVGALVLSGCDVRPPVPKTADGRTVKSVVVNPSDPEEAAAVRNLLEAEGRYRQALKVLKAYYVQTGNFDKQRWSERELQNLDQAREFRFEGIGAVPPPPAQSLEGVSEAALVEQVVAARRSWQGKLGELADLYRRKGLNFKLALVSNIQRRFFPERTYAYFLEAEIPPASLRPKDVIPEADALFKRALKLHESGKPLPLITDYPKQRRALQLFLRLIREYPTSTKIAEAAFYIGEIYKEYFNENIRAVKWYERAWQWDPHILKPARFQAAVVYDLRLAQYGKALELYRQVIDREPFNQSNVDFARNRIEQLTRPKQ